MIKIFYCFIFCLFSNIVLAQNIQGIIQDSKNNEPLIGVNIITEEKKGTASNIDGEYTLGLSEGPHKITFKYLGYKKVVKEFVLKKGENKIINIKMNTDAAQLNTIVVSAGKFEQKLEEITVSMEVIKPDLIENKNTTDIQTVMDQVPGVNITDGQANIRGGSGWSYGAGTRVLVMVDEMPLISGDAGQVQWKLIGTENISQIEVIKGASSVLYGSSALNGVINIRTAFPSGNDINKNPSFGYTKINTHFGLIDFAKREELNWSGTPTNQGGVLKDKRRAFKGLDFFHAQKIKTLDLTIGGSLFEDDGYRKSEKTSRKRINFSTKYRSSKIKGLSYGLLGNFLTQSSGYVLVWNGYDKAYIPLNNESSLTIGQTYNIDPFITYMNDNNRHSLKTRYLKVINDNSTNGQDNMQDNESDLFYADYQWQRNLEKYNLKITTGTTNEIVYAKSDLFNGNYSRSNHAIYTQMDKKWRKFNFSFGTRYEHFRITSSDPYINSKGDTVTNLSTGRPVFRTGMNYQLGEATFIRSSFGQGFRFPSIAEMFISAQAVGLEIFNNPELKAEHGWSGEIGIKQGLKFGKWKGYLDVAGFLMQYDNMMEFSFGYWDSIVSISLNPNGDIITRGIGFKSLNVGTTQISGLELSIAGSGNITKDLQINILAGYTYIHPIPLYPDSIYEINTYKYALSDGTIIPDSDTTFLHTYNNSSFDPSVLKYRYQHIAKFDLEILYKQFSVGTSIRYNDFMKNIDKIFTDALIQSIIPGINESRGDDPETPDIIETHNKRDIIIDMRAGVKLNKNLRLGLIVNNLMNVEYTSRPGDMRPPRTIAVQCSYKL